MLRRFQYWTDRYDVAMHAQAFVGSDDGEHFDAHVEMAEPGPFSLLNGPRGVPVDVAVDWARGQAKRVLVRTGDVLYSAGAEPLPSLAQWPEQPRGERTGQQPASSAWRVQATTGWYLGEAGGVAARMLRELGRDARVRDAQAAGSARRLELAFVVDCKGEMEAHAEASEILRTAWSRLSIVAVPGRDYDVS